MNFKLDALFDAAGKPYLDDSALAVISQYVSSIPERLKIYSTVRDQEISLMQPIADSLQQMPGQSEAAVERSVRNGLMVLRYVAMAMLLDDTEYLEVRLQGWLPEMVKAYETRALDQQIFQLLPQQLAQVLTPAQQNLLKPGLEKAQNLMLNTRETVAVPLAGMF